MDDSVGGILLVSLGKKKRGRPIRAFEDKGKEMFFRIHTSQYFFRQHLLILPPAFYLQVKKSSKHSQNFIPRAECCLGIMQQEIHATERQESAHSIPRRINVYVTPCARDSIYEFHVLQKLWCTDQNLMYSAYGLAVLFYLCGLRKGKERGKPSGAVTLSLFKPEQKEGLYFQEPIFSFLLATQ